MNIDFSNQDNPYVFILTRSNQRPNFFKMNHESLEQQTYKKWIHLVSYHNTDTLNYLKPYVENSAIKIVEVPVYIRENANHFPYNLYCNFLHQEVRKELLDQQKDHALIMYLDDDDIFTDITALEQIVHTFKSTGQLGNINCTVIYWKTKFPNEVLPSNKYFGKKVGLRTPAISFAFTADLIDQAKWDQYKGSDSRLARHLASKCSKILWLNQILTKVNYNNENGGSGLSNDVQT